MLAQCFLGLPSLQDCEPRNLFFTKYPVSGIWLKKEKMEEDKEENVPTNQNIACFVQENKYVPKIQYFC